MQDKLEKLATFEVKIGGISFLMRRRTTLIMALIGDPVVVFGLLAKAQNREQTPEQQEKDMAGYRDQLAEMEDKVCPEALISIDGTLFDPELHPVDAVCGVLLKQFLGSGLDVDPITGSSTGDVEPGQNQP